MLDGWLDYHRDTMLGKCEGLTEEQLKTRSCEPSRLTLLGLVRHMAGAEGWFTNDGLTGPVGPDSKRDGSPYGAFDDVTQAEVVDNVDGYRRAVARSRAFCAAHEDLDEVCASRGGEDITLRWIYLHMIEEYARRNGHADLLRERIDGLTGD